MSKISDSKSVRDMTTGSISTHIIMFALPLIAGNLFQQLYSLVDTWVVGNYVGDTAFSAIGAVNPATRLMVNLFMGFSTGASIVVSQYFGANNKEKVKKSANTAIFIAIIASIILSIAGNLLIPVFLSISKIPDSLIADASTYLSILFTYITFSVFYNMGSALLRAIGDSRKPTIFLIVTAFANVFLDLLFVIKFKMGVAGAAYATVIAQAVSAILVVIELVKSRTDIKIDMSCLKPDIDIFKRIIGLGFPIAAQSCIVQLSNIFVMSYFSFHGDAFLGGYTAYNKVDQVFLLVSNSLGMSTTTFVGQNIGAKKVKRAIDGPSCSVKIHVVISLILIAIMEAFAPQIVAFFNDSPDIVKYGSELMRINTPFFLIGGLSHIYSGFMHGIGDTRTSTIISILNFVVLRQVYLFVVTRYIANTTVLVGLCFPVGILANGIVMTIVAKYKENQLLKQYCLE